MEGAQGSGTAIEAETVLSTEASGSSRGQSTPVSSSAGSFGALDASTSEDGSEL